MTSSKVGYNCILQYNLTFPLRPKRSTSVHLEDLLYSILRQGWVSTMMADINLLQYVHDIYQILDTFLP